MVIRQYRGGVQIEEKGLLPVFAEYGGVKYLTTTALLHFCYDDFDNHHHLKEVIVSCIPNGLLQERYNPSAEKTFWLAGRNAPTRGEIFRVRLGFSRLKKMCRWRVQNVSYNEPKRQVSGHWDE